MNASKQKLVKRKLRHNRVRSVVRGMAGRPRLSVFRSNQHMYAQLIDDTSGKTLLATNTQSVTTAGAKKADKAKLVGEQLAKKALAAGITSVVFDRGGYKYHGRVKALADAAREAGLKF